MAPNACHHRIPGAHSPQVLARLLEALTSGIRARRALQESMGLSAQTVRSYLHAAEWLGFLERLEPPTLSNLGLAFVYGGSRRQQVYVRAVWSNPVAADLLTAGDGRLPEVADVQRVIQGLAPNLSLTTARRRASALRNLIAPAVGRPRPRAPGEAARQAQLPLGHAPVGARAPKPPRPNYSDDHPDVYRFFWNHLLDHGELSLTHVRSLLDRSGCSAIPIDGPVQRAQSRGDAVLSGGVLVATSASLRRRSLARSTSSIILSDPGYRAYLRNLTAPQRPPPPLLAARFADWDGWLFGRPACGERLHVDLASILLERSLDSFPLARGDALVPPIVGAPFLTCWDVPGLPIAIPPTLAQLEGGLDAVNRFLEGTVVAGRPPDPTLAPRVVHGPILFPGESPPELLGDDAQLRARALRCAPGVAIVCALLLLHRQRPHRMALQLMGSGWAVRIGRRSVPLFEFLERLAAARGWMLVRREVGGMDDQTLMRILARLEVATIVGRQAVLAESLHLALGGTDHGSLGPQLHALAVAVAEKVDACLM